MQEAQATHYTLGKQIESRTGYQNQNQPDEKKMGRIPEKNPKD
jgi:hypothetical protein